MTRYRWIAVLVAAMASPIVNAQDSDPFDTAIAPAPVPEATSVEDSAPPVNPVVGTIRRVTLYRNQALVTRELKVEPNQASGVITVVDLPDQLVPDSVYAEGDGVVQVRAVRVTSRLQLAANDAKVRELDQAIEQLDEERALSEQMLQVSAENLASLKNVGDFAAQKTSDDLNRGTLNASTAIELADYVMKMRGELVAEQLQLQVNVKKLTRQLAVLENQKSQWVAGNQREQFESKIFIECPADQGGTVLLNYIVGGCGWSPQYSIRGSVDQQDFSIRYSAMVQQISGESWDDVILTLSTASPSVSATGPSLTPFRVSAGGEFSNQAAQQMENLSADALNINEQAQAIRRQQRNVETEAFGKASKSSPMQRDMQLNKLAGQLQTLELEAEANVAARMADDADDEVATQVYTLGQSVSLESRRQQQLVQIDELKLAGQMYHLAIPLLTSYAYREAEITNTSSMGLLGGPAAVYLDDRFVGQTNLLTTASGQRLLVGFGADQQVRIRRELRSKGDSIRGGNRNLEFNYRLVVSNFKNKELNLRLYDRIPVVNEARDVTVTLTPPKEPLSTDALYERIAKQRGILRWDLTVPADSNGSKALDVEYTYGLEFDRNRTLSTEEMEQQAQVDYFYQQQSGGGMGGGMGGMGGSFMPSAQP